MVGSASRVVVTGDGTLAAVGRSDRIELFGLPGLEPRAEISIDPAATGYDLALIGAPARLVVLARYSDHAALHVIDPDGPSQLGEQDLRPPPRLLAAVGNFLLLGSGASSSIFDIGRRDLAIMPVPLRVAISAAGALDDEHFVLSTGGTIEEWDARERAPKRRYRIGRAAVARHIGAGQRKLWLIAEPDGDRLEVLTRSNPSHSQQVVLPEPAGCIAVDAAGDRLAILGAHSGSVMIVDLLGRKPITRLSELRADAVAITATNPPVVVIARDGGLELIALDRVVDEDARALASGGEEPTVDSAPRSPDPAPVNDTIEVVEAAGGAVAAKEPAPPPPGDKQGGVAERLLRWREQMRASLRTGEPERRISEERPTWRDELAGWTRTVLAGTASEPPDLQRSSLTDAIDRLQLERVLARGVLLLYGAHLCGHDVAPIDLSRAMGGRWDEALGGGRLAGDGIVKWRRSRARLAPEILAAVDEHPPRFGQLIGETTPARIPGAIVVPAGVPLDAIAGWAAWQVGRLLVPDPRRVVPVSRMALEARVRGAALLVDRERGTIDDPALVTVPSVDDANVLGLAVLAVWDESRSS